MAADVAVKSESQNSCCAVLKQKYIKLEEKRNALRQAVKLLQQQIDKILTENLNLKKAYEEERARVEIEREEKVKELAFRVSMEDQISALKSEISLLQQKGRSEAQDGNGEVTLLRVCVSEGETEINKLKELLEKERIRADSGRKNAEAEKEKAAEAWKIVKTEKSKADEERRLADIERKKAEEYRLRLVTLKKEADEARSKLVVEKFKSEEATKKRLEAEKQNVIIEKKRADSEMAKAEDRRKLAEANRKKAMEEKCRADNLSMQLESLTREANESKLVWEKVNTRLEAETQKAIREKKRADSEMVKVEEQRKLAEANRKKAMEEKCHADKLSRQLEEDRRRIEELQKEIHEFSSTRKLVVAPSVPPDKKMNVEIAKMKLLKKQLRFEKMQVKHAQQVAKLEKSRNTIVQQELARLKQEFVQFTHRLGVLDNCLSRSSEGIDDLEKTGNFSTMQSFNLRRKLSGIRQFQMYHRTENELVKPSCTAMDASDRFRQTVECTAPLLPISGGNCTESISGIDSILEPLLGGSNRKMLESSAVNSSTASFSDRQLVGSQDRGPFPITTSAKLAEENCNLQPTISRLSGEVTKRRYNENLAVVAENSVRSPLSTDVVGRVTGNSRKRKRILDAVESIEYLYSEGKKLHLQIEEKLSIFNSMLNRQMDKPLEGGMCLVPNLDGDSYAKHGRSRKKRKASLKQQVVMQHLCDSDERTETEKNGTKGSEEANVCTQASLPAVNITGTARACKDGISDSVRSDQETMVSFEEVDDGDFMKLLDLDNVDEERYRIAIETPLSPTLPEIEFQSSEAFEIDNSKGLVEEILHEGLPNENENPVPSCSFDVINVDINSNKLNFNPSGTSHSPLHKCEGFIDSFENPENKENGFCSTMYAGNSCVDEICSSVVEVEMPNVSTSTNEGAKFPCESELGSVHDDIPKYIVVFSDTKESSSISRIFRATRSCIARCCLVSQTDWVVQKMLLALAMEDLLPKEKVCVFFSLLLHNFSGAALRIFGNFLTRESILCLESFAAHISAVMSDVEARSVFAELCHLDKLLSLIEDFLIDRKVLVYNDVSQESSLLCDSRMDVLLDGVNIVLSSKTASTPQLVAGSIILASICAAVDHIGFICEASYNIFRTQSCDSSLMLTILHVFAHLCGEKYFTLSNYSLIMTVMKSIVTFLEGANFSIEIASVLPSLSEVQPEFTPCAKCPFSEGAASVDIVIVLLLEKLQNYALADAMHQDLMESVNSLNSGRLSHSEKAERNSIHEDDPFVLGMKRDVSCCLNKYGMHATQSDSVFDGSLCHCADVLSLVELVACNMSWEWTCNKIVPQLLKMLELCVLENFSAAIVILLGQLGRLGVVANGYEDTGVENLRCRLSAFLCRKATRKLGLPIQIATMTALLGLLSLNFEEFILSNVELPAVATQSVPVDVIRKWFSSLSNEQQSLSFSFLKPVGVHKI